MELEREDDCRRFQKLRECARAISAVTELSRAMGRGSLAWADDNEPGRASDFWEFNMGC